MEVFSATMPRPGENGNLNADPRQTELWRGADGNGLAALQWFFQRQLNGVETYTQQDIVEEALLPWLQAEGLLD